MKVNLECELTAGVVLDFIQTTDDALCQMQVIFSLFERMKLSDVARLRDMLNPSPGHKYDKFLSLLHDVLKTWQEEYKR
jgi:hypothetical protein